MTRTLKKMPTPQGIGAGQTATVNLPLGLTYHRLNIRMNVDSGPARDVPAADWGNYIDEIRLNVDGEQKIIISAEHLVKLNQYHGQTLVDGVLPLFLSAPWMRTTNGEDQTAYGTAGGLATLTLEMDLKSGITINSLNVYAVQSAGTPFGPHLRIQKYVNTQGVAGEKEIADIVRGRYALLALHVASAAITNCEVLADNRKVHESDKQLRLAHYGVVGRVPQAGFTHIDFCTENRLAEALPMALQDFRLKLTYTGTGVHPIYAESIQGAAA